jgi:hypothetical protein
MKERFKIEFNCRNDAFELSQAGTLIARFVNHDSGMYFLDATDDEEFNEMHVRLVSKPSNFIKF